MKKKLIQSARGFTLIELMIVVAIIGILAAIAIPKFADLVTRSKESSVKGSLGALRSAVSIYYSDNEGFFPVDVNAGLTTAAKYLQAIPTYTIPPVTAQSNPGHSNVGGPAGISSSATGTTVTDNGNWWYFNSGNSMGNIQVGCSHNDTKGSVWSAY